MVERRSHSSVEVMSRVRQSARLKEDRGLHSVDFHAMSTPCQVKLHGVPTTAAVEFLRDAVEWVAQFEGRYSRFVPDSLVSRINTAAGMHWVEIDQETDRLFQLCHELYFFTRGSFDPTALPLIQLWDWKNRPPRLPDESSIKQAKSLVGWNKVQRRSGGIYLPETGMSIDLGGIGKEYAVDCVVNMAVHRGIPNVLVNFGQDVRARGQAPEKKHWLIGLEDAFKPGHCWTGAAVTDHAVATSGDYNRHFVLNGRRYGHILDPRTGWPAQNDCRAATVIAPSCTIAGLLSTSICILGAKEGLDLVELHPGAAAAVTTNTTRLNSRKLHEYIPA